MFFINKLKDEQGISAIATALMFPFFIGAIALSIDMGYARLDSDRITNIADTVSHSIEADLYNKCNGTECTYSYLQQEANDEANKNGCGSGLHQCNIALTWPYNSNSNMASVSISRQQIPTVAHLIGSKDFSASSAAVADVSKYVPMVGKKTDDSGTGCLLALEESNTGVMFQNGQTGSLAGMLNSACGVFANSTSSQAILLQNNATIAGLAETPGSVALVNNNPPNQISSAGSIKDSKKGGVAVSDPYAGETVSFSDAGECLEKTYNNGQGFNWNSGTYNIPPGHYCNGWNANGSTLVLSEGMYFVDNSMNLNGANITSNGKPVTIVTGSQYGGFNINMNNSNINLVSGSNSDVLPGIIWTSYSGQDVGTMYINSGNTFQYTGAIYLPDGEVYIRNGANFGSINDKQGCGQIVAKEIGAETGFILGMNCSDDDGTKSIGEDSGD